MVRSARVDLGACRHTEGRAAHGSQLFSRCERIRANRSGCVASPRRCRRLRRTARRDASRGKEGRTLRHGNLAPPRRGAAMGARDSHNECTNRFGPRHARAHLRRRLRDGDVDAHRTRPARLCGRRARCGGVAHWPPGRVYNAGRVGVSSDAGSIMKSTRLAGCGTALVTPFAQGGAVDERALRSIVEWQIAEGVHFLVPCGSTGEAATMTPEEQRRVIEIVVEVTNGRVPVVAGAASNDTQRAIALSKGAQAAGATHLLHTSPMYNKPPQRGIVAHYRAIADAVDLPIVVYNIPGRTGSNIEAKTTLEMADIKGIHAVKEASGNLNQIADVIQGRERRKQAPRFAEGDSAPNPDALAEGGGLLSQFSILSGDDEMT